MSRYSIRRALWCLLAAGVGVARAAGQDGPVPAAVPATQRLSPEQTLAEGVYADEFLRDPATAAEYYRRAALDPRSQPGQRQDAGWRLARCLRRLHRPDAARGILQNLLRDPALSTEVRAQVEAELGAIPRVNPARLMPADTLIYVEIPQPGWLLEQVVALLRRAGLDEAVRAALLETVRREATVELRGFLNEAVQAELAKTEGAGIGWRNVRCERRAGELRPAADVLFVLPTGESGATAGVLQGVIAGMLVPETTIDEVEFFAPAGPRPSLRFAIADGLFVACSDPRDGAEAVRRYRGAQRGTALHAQPDFKRAVPRARRADAVWVYVDWPRLVDCLVAAAPEDRREEIDIATDVLALRDIGPVTVTAVLAGDVLTIELVAAPRSSGGLLCRLFRTPALEPPWRRWVPSDAIAGLVTGVTPGERRWRDLERFLVEMARLQRLHERGGAAPPGRGEAGPAAPTTASQAAEQAGAVGAATGRTRVDTPLADPLAAQDPLARLRRFEQGTQLSLAEDVWRGVNAAALIWLAPPAGQVGGGEVGPRWVLVLDVDQADVWLRRIERGLRRWLFGPLSDAPLPKTTVATPVGPVELLALPRTRIGLAWQVEGRRVAVGFGIDRVVDYLTQVRSANAPATVSPRAGIENKLVSVRLDRVLAYWFGRSPATQPWHVVPPSWPDPTQDPSQPAGWRADYMAGRWAAPPARTDIAPLVVRSYESNDAVQVVMEQEELADLLRESAHILGVFQQPVPPPSSQPHLTNAD